ncbi:MAG: hypothetical protein P1U85_13490 [Verrucomicrobiales bacterium]|jgi:hypothetical protein|nr:hypothetical protein [Verrucomicrobiales bacterium]
MRYKLAGIILLLSGLAGAGITAIHLGNFHAEGRGETAVAIAEGVRATLVPAMVGSFFVVGGLISLLRGWWLGRKAKRLIV